MNLIRNLISKFQVCQTFMVANLLRLLIASIHEIYLTSNCCLRTKFFIERRIYFGLFRPDVNEADVRLTG